MGSLPGSDVLWANRYGVAATTIGVAVTTGMPQTESKVRVVSSAPVSKNLPGSGVLADRALLRVHIKLGIVVSGGASH